MTASSRWDPVQYERFATERGRPFSELVSRVFADEPRRVVDLGCGTGGLTAELTNRWPDVAVTGIDSSPEMIAVASSRAACERVSFRVGDLTAWAPEQPVDVVVSNAALQWVPGHLDLLPRLLTGVAPGGWFAFQVPGNFTEPSHRLLTELAAEQPWAGLLAGQDLARPASHDPLTYLDALGRLGHQVDAWETTYLHVLAGPDAVFEWIKGTGARPVLQALPDDRRPAFEAAYRERLRAAYPARKYGTVLPFRRIFVVVRVVA